MVYMLIKIYRHHYLKLLNSLKDNMLYSQPIHKHFDTEVSDELIVLIVIVIFTLNLYFF